MKRCWVLQIFGKIEIKVIRYSFPYNRVEKSKCQIINKVWPKDVKQCILSSAAGRSSILEKKILICTVSFLRVKHWKQPGFHHQQKDHRTEIYAYTGMLCNSGHEQTTAPCINMNEAERCKIEWKSQVTKKCKQYEPNCLPAQSRETEQHTVKYIHAWF